MIVLSYQYITNPLFRKSIAPLLENSIIVFDEAHNIEGTLEDATLFSFSSYRLTEMIKELENLIEIQSNVIPTSNTPDLKI